MPTPEEIKSIVEALNTINYLVTTNRLQEATEFLSNHPLKEFILEASENYKKNYK